MNNELYHWGIKGQKWGIRRYQNEDGTLTSAGKRRYGKYISEFDRQLKREYSKDSDMDRAVDAASARITSRNKFEKSKSKRYVKNIAAGLGLGTSAAGLVYALNSTGKSRVVSGGVALGGALASIGTMKLYESRILKEKVDREVAVQMAIRNLERNNV